MALTKGPKVTKSDKPKQRQRKDDEVVERGIPRSATHQDGDGGERGSSAVKGNSGGPDTDLCADCGKMVQTTHQGLQCNRCGFWHHTTCEKVADDVYQFLDSHNDPSLLWNCRKCVATCKKMMAVMASMQEQQQRLEDKVTELTNTFNKKIDDMTKNIQTDMDNKVLEQRFAGDVIQKSVEEKFEVIMDSMKQKMDLDVPGAVGDAVSNRLREDQEEMDEIRKRRTNVIIYSLKESSDQSSEKRVKEDEDLVQDLMHQINCDTVSAKAWIRLGKRHDDPVASPRPLMLVLSSEDQKEMVLKNAKNLRDRKTNGWDRIFIHPDRTPRQREKRQHLVQQLKQRQAAGENNLIIVNDRIVVRRSRSD